MASNKDFNKPDAGFDRELDKTKQLPNMTDDEIANLDSQNETDEIELTPKRSWWTKKKAIAVGAAAVVLIGGTAIGAFALNMPQPETPKTESNQPVATPVKKTSEKAAKQPVEFKIDKFADANEKTTPVIYHVVGTQDEGKKAVDFWHAERLVKDGDNWGADGKVELEKGDYKVTEVVTPINDDGSIYRVEVKDGEVSKAPEKVKAEDVTQEQLDQILDKVHEAVQNGDDTLKGEEGKKVVEDVANNAASNPNADKDKVNEKADAAKESVSNEGGSNDSGQSSTATGGDNNNDRGSTDNNSSNSGNAVDAPSGGGNSSSGGNSGNSTPAPEPTPAPKPEPVWIDTSHWEDNWVTVIDAPAQTIYYHEFYFSDGTVVSDKGNVGGVDPDELSLIHGNYSVNTKSETIPAQTHQENQPVWVESGYWQ